MFWKVSKKEAAARRSSKMESRDHFKNGVNMKNLKKRFCSVLLAVFFTASFAQAQVSFGVSAGTNTSKISGLAESLVKGGILRYTGAYKVDKSSWRYGFHIGGVVEYRPFILNDAWSIQPGLFLVKRGDIVNQPAIIYVSGKGDNRSVEVNLTYVQLPLNIQYNLGDEDNGTLQLFAGPYLGYAIGGSITTKVTNFPVNKEKIKFGDGVDYHFKSPLDYGLVVGVSAGYFNFLQVRIGFSMGLMDISNTETIMYNRCFDFSITLLF